jgi:hypothetical protein
VLEVKTVPELHELQVEAVLLNSRSHQLLYSEQIKSDSEFPLEHLAAVYAPFIIPIGLPILSSAVKFLRGKSEVEQA